MADGRVDIEVDVDTDGLRTGVKRITSTLERMDKRLGTLTKHADQSGDALNRMATRGHTLVAALTALAPALAPIGGVAAGALGALTSSLAAATAGFALFGAVAITNLSGAEELAQKFKQTWMDFATQFRKPVFEIANKGLKIFQSVLPMLTPVVQGATDAVNSLMDAFGRYTETAEFKGFINWLANEAGQHMIIWAKTAGNLVRGLLGMFQAFTPLADSVGQSMLTLSQRFAQWGQSLQSSDKFKQFMTFVKTNGPTVWEFFAQLGSLIINLGVALTPVGLQILKFANYIMRLTNNFIQNNPQMAAFIGYLISFGAAAKVAVTVGAKVVAAFTRVKGIITKVAPWVRKIGRFLLMVGKRALVMGARVAAGWVAAMGPVGWVIGIVIAVVAVIVANWDKVKSWTKKAWTAASNAVRSAVQKMKSLAQSGMSKIRSIVSSAVSKIKSLYSRFKSAGANLIKGLVSGIKSMAKRAVSAAANVAKKAYNAVTSFLGIHSPSRLMMEVGGDFGAGFNIGINDMVRKAQRVSTDFAKASVSAAQAETPNNTGAAPFSPTINVQGGPREEDIARASSRELQRLYFLYR